ncbi:MAG: outer membrane beta-barrel protein [Muribaculaceae bacterium]|nr:outer membrane beta-barrel protein [Muribaculaceae bacterium]
MKKFITLAILAFSTICASAQAYVGGTFGITRDITDNETNFTIAPEVGYNFTERWAVGGTLNYTYNYNDGMKSNVFVINPYARWTFCRVADDRLGFFVDGSVGVGGGSSKYKDYKSESIVVWNIGLKPGISFSFNDHCSIVAHVGFLGFNGANRAAKNAGFTENFGLDFSSMNLNFGFYYSF